MKRLLEQPATDRLSARAQSLLQAVGATAPSEERARRVRRALDTASTRAWPRWAPRLAFAATLVAAGAAAAAGLGALEEREERPSEVRAPVLAPSQLAPSPALRAREPEPALSASVPRPPLVPPRSSASIAVSRASSDVARVHEAARALTRHDAARALSLLEREPVMPGSPLAEEALALRIRASAALRNGRETKLAKSYLSLYPHGRYRELATRAAAEGSW